MQHKYKCIHHSPLHTNDCILSLCLHKNYIVTGTLMGYVNLILIDSRRTNDSHREQLIGADSYRTTERPILKSDVECISHISCVFINDNNIYIGLNDRKMLCANIAEVTNASSLYHKTIGDKCVSTNEGCSKDCTLMMANNRLLLIHTKFGDNKDKKITNTTFAYENRNLSNDNDIVTGEVKSTNFSVPFDFDGDRYVYIEYIENSSKTQRKLCVHYTLTYPLQYQSKSPISVDLAEDYGHISHLKLIHNNIVFLVKNLNECVIAELNQSNELIQLCAFAHLGEEIIASACYIDTEHFAVTGNPTSLLLLDNNRAKGETYTSEINWEVNGNEMNYTNNDIVQNVKIVTVDLEGNVNMFHQKQETTLFNIYDVDNIDKDFKKKMLFDIGYPYYVAFNNEYLVITTDYGAFVFVSQ